MTAAVVRADARNLPLPDASVDLVVTSPPYFALRSYQDGGEHYDGQIGAEATPREYIDALLECTREWTRVLKPSGSIFVNLGDKYGPDKSLLYLPERYRIGTRDELGLIGRSVMIWSKTNGLPESVTDRVRRSHEDWVHLTKEPRYYSAVDEIREPHARSSWATKTRMAGRREQQGPGHDGLEQHDYARIRGVSEHPLGRLPGSVWEVATQPLKAPAHLGVDHFAAFPSALPMRIIAGWSPPGICTACGEGRRPTSERELTINRKGRQRNVLDRPERGVDTQTLGWEGVHRITGYACACPTPDAPTRSALVVDPFGGTGTTALAARALGRNGISFDLSHDYARLAQWRTTDPGELARVLGKPKPQPVVPGQGDLFADEAIA